MPFIPLIAAGVGAVGSIIGGKMNKDAAKTAAAAPASQPTDLEKAQLDFINFQKQYAQWGMETGKPLIAKATGAYDTTLDFYKKIQSAPDDELLRMFNAGEYTKSADESAGIAENILGRSGARAAVTGQVSEDRAAVLQRVLAMLRAAAPGQIANVGQAYANLGTNLAAAGGTAGATASNIAFGQQQLGQQADIAAADRRANLIASIIGAAGSVAGVIAAMKTKS